MINDAETAQDEPEQVEKAVPEDGRQRTCLQQNETGPQAWRYQAVMSCYFPIYVQGHVVSGRGIDPVSRPVPCGKCVGCMKQTALSWATRCYHESRLHENNCFVTLTYSPEHLPSDGSLSKAEVQTFIKNLRNKYGDGIRFFAGGEYGDAGNRPHYHILLFNHKFPDLVNWKLKRNHMIYRSPELEKIWTKGFSTVGALEMESIVYTAMYAQKRVTGDEAENHYKGRTPEFALMSRNPGLGSGWIHKRFSDVYPKDFFTIDGQKYKSNRFYDTKLGFARPKMYAEIKAKRQATAAAKDEGPHRRCEIAHVKKLYRKKLERREL